MLDPQKGIGHPISHPVLSLKFDLLLPCCAFLVLCSGQVQGCQGFPNGPANQAKCLLSAPARHPADDWRSQPVPCGLPSPGNGPAGCQGSVHLQGSDLPGPPQRARRKYTTVSTVP